MHYLPYQGKYKQLSTNENTEEVDEFTILALCKKANISVDEMKHMSFVSLVNTLVSYVEEKPTTRKATKEDIERFVGRR